MPERIEKTEQEWRAALTPQQFRVLRKGGTEVPFTGEYHACHVPGTYRCAACDTPLFDADAKFDSRTGWPSFTAPVDADNVRLKSDRKRLMRRTEVLCAACDSHLGHVFDDGPRPTGQRFCMNSAALTLDHDHSVERDGEP